MIKRVIIKKITYYSILAFLMFFATNSFGQQESTFKQIMVFFDI